MRARTLRRGCKVAEARQVTDSCRGLQMTESNALWTALTGGSSADAAALAPAKGCRWPTAVRPAKRMQCSVRDQPDSPCQKGVSDDPSTVRPVALDRPTCRANQAHNRLPALTQV